MRNLSFALCLGMWVAVATAAEPAKEAPHDHAAPEKLGHVSLPTSCEPRVQPAFNRAVALMHSFQFGPAIEGFEGVLAVDPGCAMADWGIALSRWGNPFASFKTPEQVAAGHAAVEQGLARHPKTARERGYLEAVGALYADHVDAASRPLAYEAAMARLAAAYPDDTEARIFYALALAAAADPNDTTYAKQLKAGAMLEQLFARQPDHPGLAHYLIHAYDVPALASRAAEAARRYGRIAPSTPHALHMPSHTFTRIGDWQASIDTNLASLEAARKAGQPADVLHASDYLAYAYLQTGQDTAAKGLLAVATDARARLDPAHTTGAAPASAAFFALAAIPARVALERHAWDEAAALDTPPSPFAYADALTAFARGLGAAHHKDTAAAQAAIANLDRLRETLAKADETYWVHQLDIQRRIIAAMLAYTTGDIEHGLADLRAAADQEDPLQLTAVTPGPLIPAREALGECLLDQGHAADALQAFETTLKHEPNRFWALRGAAEAAAASGNAALARTYADTLKTQTAHADAAVREALATKGPLRRP